MYCITYPCGAYGKFISWTLLWLSGVFNTDARPFNGQNAHSWNSDKILADTVEQACDIAKSGLSMHPVYKDSQTLSAQLEKLSSVYNKIVYLYPDKQDYVWYMNNKIFKVWPGNSGLQVQFEHLGHDYLNKAPWEQREYLSLFYYDKTLIEVCQDEIEYLNKTYIKTVPINSIRDNFMQTIISIADWCNIKIKQTDSNILSLHKDWMSVEKYLFKDKLINDLVNSIITGEHKDMHDLTIVDESEIQRRLRNKGFEIQCYELNKWPNTTTELRELIYET